MAGKCLILDGLGSGEASRESLRGMLKEQVTEAGYVGDWAMLGPGSLTPCQGCFGCWTRTPGVCLIDDFGRELAERMIGAEAVVFLTPVVFGGYSALVKTALERCALPTLLPFFTQVAGRTRHPLRYGRNPDLIGLGWLARPDGEQERLFGALVARNAANLRPSRYIASVVHGSDAPATVRQCVSDTMSFKATAEGGGRQRIVILTGSPKRTGSVSAALGAYLGQKAATHGAVVETVSLLAASTDETVYQQLLAHLTAADGVVLTFPLYGDFLPGHVLDVLERITKWRLEQQALSSPGLVAVANCGFPEARNNNAALDACRLFAREAGFTWLGGCAVGGGGMYEGRDLEGFGWLSRKVRAALEKKAALLLGRGGAEEPGPGIIEVPCPLPGWLYVKIAEMGWKKTLGAGGKKIDALARPYACVGSDG